MEKKAEWQGKSKTLEGANWAKDEFSRRGRGVVISARDQIAEETKRERLKGVPI